MELITKLLKAGGKRYGGWQFEVIILEGITYRFPKNSAAKMAMQREANMLAELGELPLRVPKPKIVKGIMVYEAIEGTPFYAKDTSPECAVQLGNFLKCLHVKKTETWDRGAFVRHADEFQKEALGISDWPDDVRASIEYLFRKYRNLNLDLGLIHGDLCPANILKREGRISGIIDWSSCDVSEVSVDFGDLMRYYGIDFTKEVLASYGNTRLLSKAVFFSIINEFHDFENAPKADHHKHIQRVLSIPSLIRLNRQHLKSLKS